MIINVHAGHNPDGKIACGAVGYIKESTEARRVVSYLIPLLQSKGHTVYDCTVNNGISQNDVLKKIVKKTNSVKANLDISIHFNALNKNDPGNGITTGTEAWYKAGKSDAKIFATTICTNIAALGFKNRGPKTSNSLYYLKNCNNPAVLIECCFVNDKDDTKKYNALTMARAIADAIPTNNAVKKYCHNGVDYSAVFDPNYYALKNPDVKNVCGIDADTLFKHFTTFGMAEGRTAIDTFDVRVYKEKNKDLSDLFTNNWKMYYKHYCEFGKKEGRIAR